MSASTKQSRANRSSDSRLDWWAYSGPLGVILATLTVLVLVLLAAADGVSPSPAIWYLARAAGMTTYLILWISVVSGLALSLRLALGPIDQALLMPLHRFATELSLAFLVLHVVSMAFDPTVPLGMAGVLLPFMSSVRQPWTDLGIISGYLLVGIMASFGVRSYIGSRTWRRLHYLTFPLWLIALIHGIRAGSDSGTLWAGLIYILTAAAVVFLTATRLLTRERMVSHASRSDRTTSKSTPGAREETVHETPGGGR